MTENSEKLRVAFTGKSNTQLSPLDSTTDSATDAQPNSLKAASLRILERNKARNTYATDIEKGAQLLPEKQGSKVARVAQSETDETRIRAWLTHIGETDQTMIDETLQRCRDDADALSYFLMRSKEIPPTEAELDKRDALECGQTFCGDCRRFRGDDRVCGASRCPTPETLFRRCERYMHKAAP